MSVNSPCIVRDLVKTPLDQWMPSKVHGTFDNEWLAMRWLKENGYTMSQDHEGCWVKRQGILTEITQTPADVA